MEQLMAFAGNHPLLSLAWVGIFIALIVVSVLVAMSPLKKISPQALTFLVNREEGVVVDIRAANEFKKSHILDAVNFSMEKANKNDFTSLENHKDKPIIVVCAAGMTATKVANQLLKAGFKQVNLLKGGMNAWVGAGLPIAKK